jgi:hypothetical protein
MTWQQVVQIEFNTVCQPQSFAGNSLGLGCAPCACRAERFWIIGFVRDGQNVYAEDVKFRDSGRLWIRREGSTTWVAGPVKDVFLVKQFFECRSAIPQDTQYLPSSFKEVPAP